MNVCFVTEDFYPSFIGGQGIYGKNFVKSLVKKGIKVTVLCENKPGRVTYWRKIRNISVFLVPFSFGNQLLLAIFEYIYFVFRLPNIYFDIVHANQLSGFFFVLFKPKNVGKICLSVHTSFADLSEGTDSFLKKISYKPLIFLEKMIYERAEGLIFNTEMEKDLLNSFYRTKSIPYVIAPYGIDKVKNLKVSKKDSENFLAKTYGLQGCKIILYVGRLVKRKKVDLFVKVMSVLKNQKEIAGLIVGSGPEEDYLKSIAAENIVFAGFKKNPMPYFLGSDLFVNLSVAEGGVILTALEAASAGLPMLLSTQSVDSSILKNGFNGYFCDSKDPKIIAEKIKLILKKARGMGQKSLGLVEKYSWENCCRKTLNFYQDLQKV